MSGSCPSTQLRARSSTLADSTFSTRPTLHSLHGRLYILYTADSLLHHQKYTMSGATIEETSTEKDLGVHVDSDLKFRKQAATAVSKASQVMAVIRKSFQLIDKITLPLLFKTLVRPHLEYGNTVWGPFNRADQRRVERVQRRATKLVPELRDLPYPERLQALNQPSLYYRRRRGDMIAVYQMLHGGFDLDTASTPLMPETPEVTRCG